MNKPIKPEITIPQSFAENGVKTDFDDTLLADGFDNLRPDVLAGDNLNKFIDDTYKGLNYGIAAADAINLINEGETLTVINGQLTSGASGGGLEIGDIGIAPLGIDETKGKRRYLNGQLIIQEQYVQFTNKVKSAITLYPSLACTEEEWQATALLTVGGQVGKFVVDDEGGTIRLPKIIMPIQGLTDLSKLAEIVEAGLPNIEALFGAVVQTQDSGATTSGAFDFEFITKSSSNVTGGTNTDLLGNIKFNASKSNPIYGNSTTVQQEQIQYPYFIQVATGAETKDEIINTLELNNPYSFGDIKYSQIILNNLSWLRSEGQWTPKIDYTAYYDWILTNANNGEELFKLSTEEYDDYCWVVNTAEETFRLPIKVKLASGKAVVGNGMTLGVTDGTQEGSLAMSSNGLTGWTDYKNPIGTTGGTGWTNSQKSVGLTTDPTKSGIETSDNGLYLYFYVGETVQNANLINAGRIEEKLVNYTTHDMVDGQWIVSELELSSAVAIGTYEIDLSSYLPNDTYNYEVLVSHYQKSNANTGSATKFWTDYFPNTIYTAATDVNTVISSGAFIAVVGSRRTISKNISSAVSTQNILKVHAYRRVGTNI